MYIQNKKLTEALEDFENYIREVAMSYDDKSGVLTKFVSDDAVLCIEFKFKEIGNE